MGIVETDQIRAIANLLSKIDAEIPFTILAFFPEYRMMKNRAPNLQEMIEAFATVKATGLKNVRLGKTGIFAQEEEDYQLLLEEVGLGSF
jgi:pyruvate formate lyase activating enzyme